ncbi:sensor histidine kinase [Lentzea sp. NPDC060358]|uniref:sensor histidine kinase n=1 Tax=Lentzea sp. NPDC060358 TaxID=3347103 RepID=UPI0036497E1E
MTFADEMFRPLVVLVVSAVAVVQLAGRPPLLPALTWALTAVAVATALASALGRVPVRARTAVVVASVLASAPLFGLAPATAAVALVFVACGTAGRELESRQLAIGVAATGAVLAMVSTWVSGSPDVPPWWLCLTAGLPVFLGMIRRERDAAAAAAEYAAALEERGRIAREIHDVVGHALSGIAVQLDMADALHAAGKSEEANDAVLRARALAVSGLKETRRAVHALREDTLSLPEALAKLAENHRASFRVAGAGEVGVEVTQAVLRTAQEALTNAHKHAPGADVDLVLEYESTSVRLTVSDNGQNHREGSGMGLAGMRERAALLGGTLAAGPGGPGWTVRLELPR